MNEWASSRIGVQAEVPAAEPAVGGCLVDAGHQTSRDVLRGRHLYLFQVTDRLIVEAAHAEIEEAHVVAVIGLVLDEIERRTVIADHVEGHFTGSGHGLDRVVPRVDY